MCTQEHKRSWWYVFLIYVFLTEYYSLRNEFQHVCKRGLVDTLQWRHNGHDSVSNHQPHDCLLNRLFSRRSKKTSKLRVTSLCAGNSPGTGEFPAQMASDTENVSIWWRHHEAAAAPCFNPCLPEKTSVEPHFINKQYSFQHTQRKKSCESHWGVCKVSQNVKSSHLFYTRFIYIYIYLERERVDLYPHSNKTSNGYLQREFSQV